MIQAIRLAALRHHVFALENSVAKPSTALLHLVGLLSVWGLILLGALIPCAALFAAFGAGVLQGLDIQITPLIGGILTFPLWGGMLTLFVWGGFVAWPFIVLMASRKEDLAKAKAARLRLAVCDLDPNAFMARDPEG